MLDKKIIYFLTVAQEGSFSAAARKLIMSQPALSQQIALLEEELSVTLFDRQGYRPVLTEVGREFYDECLLIKKHCDEVRQRMLEHSHENIRIGFTGSFENKELISLVQRFRTIYPTVTISFSKTTFGGCVEGLLKKELDVSFGIDSDFKGQEELICEKLFPFQICVICSHDHPLASKETVDIQELKNENFIILSPKVGMKYYKDFMLAFKKDGFMPRIKREVDLFDELVFQVSIGDGIGIVSQKVVRETDVRVIPLVNSHHCSNYAVAYRKDLRNPIIENFIEETRHYFGTL